MTRQEILQDAVNTWGIESQVFQAIEEMAELTQALSKIRRAYCPNDREIAWANVLEEIADVRIMLDQLALIFDDGRFDGKVTIAALEAKKLARLEARLVVRQSAN